MENCGILRQYGIQSHIESQYCDRFVMNVYVSERAKLHLGGLRSSVGLALVCLLFPSCTPSPVQTPSYDTDTRRLVRLDSDLNDDGVIDHRAYMDGNVPRRAEIDQDGDGRIDRWEYFDAGARLALVGTSSARDGIEDTWTWPVAADGERRVDVSLVRDRAIDRHEFYRDNALTRAEVDSNGDGRIDRWESYEGGALRQVSLDTTLAADRPNRRIRYDTAGHFAAVEVDTDGDGQWEPSK